MRTLIVDDDLTSRTLLQRHLAGLSECVQAASGTQGLCHFVEAHEQGRRYNLVCLDIMMPGLTGRELLQAIREWEDAHDIRGLDGVKVIMTTVADDAPNIMGAFRQQCEAYLVKPIEKPAFLRQLELLGLPC